MASASIHASAFVLFPSVFFSELSVILVVRAYAIYTTSNPGKDLQCLLSFTSFSMYDVASSKYNYMIYFIHFCAYFVLG
jgi:hypothetical protein